MTTDSTEPFELKSGVSSLHLHEHVCLIYETPEEQLYPAAEYLRAGLRRSNRLVYVTDEANVESVAAQLTARAPELAPAIASGRLRILATNDTYLRCGAFNPDDMLAFLADAADEAVAEGYSGLRSTGEMKSTFKGASGVNGLAEYEARLNDLVLEKPALILCQYNRRKFPPETILNALKTHPLVIVSGRLCRNPYYIPPEEMLAPQGAMQMAERWLTNLLDLEASDEALRASESRFRVAFDHAPVGMAQATPGGTILCANSALAAILGYAPKELEGKGIDGFATPEDRDAVLEAWQTLLVEQTPSPTHRLRFVHRDGQLVWGLMTGAAVYDSHGHPVMVLTQLLDVTESIHAEQARKRAALELAESQKRLEAALDAGKVGIWVMDLQTNKLVWEGHHALLFGMTPEEFDGSFETFRSRVHPDDMAGMEDAVERARESGAPYEYQYRTVWPDGSIHWIASRGVFTYDETGRAVSMFGTVTDYTRIKQAEEYYQKSEAMLRAVLESTGDGILVVSMDGTVWHYNERFARIWGLSHSPAVTPEAMLLQEAKNLVTDPEGFLARVSEVYASKKESLDVVEMKDGRIFERRSCPLVVDDRVRGRVWNFHEITERVRAEAAVRENEERFRLLIENAPDAVFVQTEEKVVYVNPAGVALFRAKSAEDLLGRPMLELYHPDFHDIVRERVHRLNDLRERVPRIEERIIRMDGTPLDVEVSAVPVCYQGKHGSLVFGRSIEERKRMEEERRNFEGRLQQTQKLESLGVLAGGIAHDFNNLLTGILGNAELALQSLSPISPARESVEQVKVAARNAAGLTRQMLAYAGKGRFAPQAVNLNDLVKEMAHLLDVSVSKRYALKYRFAENLPLISGDPAQLRQVVMNLIINASESLEGKDGEVNVSTGVMHCDKAYFKENYLGEELAEGDYAYFSVSDTGCGMDEETVRRIFDPFFTTKFTGRGLGLAAVLGIVRSHHGAIKVSSEEGKGTDFTVLFPALESQPAFKVEEPAPAQDWKSSGTILVVDDEAGVRTVTRGMLRNAGFTVLMAKDGLEALDLFREQSDAICLVLLDLTMPQMDGLETLRELQKIRPDVKVILCSGYSEYDATSRFKDQELAGFLHKPFILSEILSVVRNALER